MNYFRVTNILLFLQFSPTYQSSRQINAIFAFEAKITLKIKFYHKFLNDFFDFLVILKKIQ